MLLNAGIFNRFRTSKRGRADVEPDSDKPLNLKQDKLPNIRKELRFLNRERGMDLAMTSAGLVLLGSGIGLVFAHRYKLASLVGAAFLLQQLLEYRQVREEDANELELERRALKLERGDFGKLEVIPFR
ncbi:hypothetical protein [Geotalea sp. SG265]|uniref:hypothetical protein n=1 Tax=Geotalea sp. SG265 TaxID=2922867 RepID=UPI001FB001B6|nr:hypothetical protein [Geotalea sp. SG265]